MTYSTEALRRFNEGLGGVSDREVIEGPHRVSDFAHRLPLDQIRDGDRLDLVADDGECAAIAERLGLLSLDRLEAHAVLSRDGQKVRATGRLKAALEQACVATGEPVAGACRRAVRAVVRARAAGSARPTRRSSSARADLDTVFHDGVGDRARQRDRRHAGAGARSLSAQRRTPTRRSRKRAC